MRFLSKRGVLKKHAETGVLGEQLREREKGILRAALPRTTFQGEYLPRRLLNSVKITSSTPKGSCSWISLTGGGGGGRDIPPYLTGGHSYWKGLWGCIAVMTPFFQASCRSIASPIYPNAPLLWPPFLIFRKNFANQPCFGQNSSSLDPNFSKFSLPRPLFFKENPLPKLYILKPAWHCTHPPKMVECPLVLNGALMPSLFECSVPDDRWLFSAKRLHHCQIFPVGPISCCRNKMSL